MYYVWSSVREMDSLVVVLCRPHVYARTLRLRTGAPSETRDAVRRLNSLGVTPGRSIRDPASTASGGVVYGHYAY